MHINFHQSMSYDTIQYKMYKMIDAYMYKRLGDYRIFFQYRMSFHYSGIALSTFLNDAIEDIIIIFVLHTSMIGKPHFKFQL